jgi:hypothetical protein
MVQARKEWENTGNEKAEINVEEEEGNIEDEDEEVIE